MGRPVPGHEVDVLDERGDLAPMGSEGEIVVRRPDPAMFLGYWNNPEATAKKFHGEWLLTGDRGRRDEDGYFRFLAGPTTLSRPRATASVRARSRNA